MNVDQPINHAHRLRVFLDAIEKWQPEIEEALTHGHHTHTFDDIVRMVMQNSVQFFSFDRCFLVMEVVEFPNVKLWHCFLAGGNMDAVIESEGLMAEIGKSLGCSHLSIAGRKGWERKLKEHGWEFVCTTMHKPIGAM